MLARHKTTADSTYTGKGGAKRDLTTPLRHA